MNWKEIQEKYPISIGKLALYYLNSDKEYRYLYSDGSDCFQLYEEDDEREPGHFINFSLVIRDLYDFFDENDIIINIRYIGTGWVCSIDPKGYAFQECYEFDTRQDAEECGFEQAFIALEYKLKRK
jgi:hypothetical protein